MSGKFNAARAAFGEGTLSWTRDRIVAQLVSAAYKFNEQHAVAASLTGKVGAAVELTGKSVTGKGWLRAANLAFPRVKGETVVAIALHRAPAAGSAQQATLIVFLDDIHADPKDPSSMAFPMVPNGGDILVSVPEQGIFRI